MLQSLCTLYNALRAFVLVVKIVTNYCVHASSCTHTIYLARLRFYDRDSIDSLRNERPHLHNASRPARKVVRPKLDRPYRLLRPCNTLCMVHRSTSFLHPYDKHITIYTVPYCDLLNHTLYESTGQQHCRSIPLCCVPFRPRQLLLDEPLW